MRCAHCRASQWRLLFCQNLVGQLPTLPTCFQYFLMLSITVSSISHCSQVFWFENFFQNLKMLAWNCFKRWNSKMEPYLYKIISFLWSETTKIKLLERCYLHETKQYLIFFWTVSALLTLIGMSSENKKCLSLLQPRIGVFVTKLNEPGRVSN